jgi:hypothetical protein
VRILRALTPTALGFSAGMATAAAVVKRAVPSRGDAESDEVELVAIFDGIDGFAAFGGVAVGAKARDAAPAS